MESWCQWVFSISTIIIHSSREWWHPRAKKSTDMLRHNCANFIKFPPIHSQPAWTSLPSKPGFSPIWRIWRQRRIRQGAIFCFIFGYIPAVACLQWTSKKCWKSHTEVERNTLSYGYSQSQCAECSEKLVALLASLDLLNPFGWTKRTRPNREHAFVTVFQPTNLEISDWAVAPRFKTPWVQDLLYRSTNLFTWN